MNYLELAYKICQPKKHDIETDKTKILNPFLVLIKLALLSFKPHETKLSIHNHNIYLIAPSILQGLSRGYYGDSKDDLHHLLFPIYTVALWLRNNKKTKKKRSATYEQLKLPGFENLLKLANNGIIILKQTYTDHVSTKHNLDIIIYILNNPTQEGLINDQNYDEEVYKKYVWNNQELSTILSLFDLCQIEPNKKRYYIESIERMLVPIEENIRDIYM
jgi:hypothetical protein